MHERIKAMTEEMHIASLVVHVVPDALRSIERALVAYEDMQVHGTHPDGKLVVTLEGSTASEIMDQVSQIRQIEGVLNVSLVYQHTEPRQLLNEGVTHD
jgi:periplasmic nitrate reductase NapD